MSAIPTDLPAPDEQQPLEETVEIPLKPGKWCGILSIVCGLEPILAIAYVFSINLLVRFFNTDISPPPGSIIEYILVALVLGSPLFVIAGIVFGIRGRKTEGRRYAIVGLVFSSLGVLLVLTGIGMIVHSILVPCC